MMKPCSKCDKAYPFKSYKTGKTRYDRCNECFHCDAYIEYEKYLEKQRKFRQDGLILSMSEFEEYTKTNNFVYIHNKIYHIGWVCSLQYHTLDNYIKRKAVKRAIRKDDEK